MELTGKCKEEFVIWLACGDGSINFEKYYNDKYGSDDPYTWFTELSKSMQYGVLEDYFDSVGINIEITNDNKDIKTFWIDINAKEIDSVELNSRPEARIAAIEKANELRNEVLNK